MRHAAHVCARIHPRRHPYEVQEIADPVAPGRVSLAGEANRFRRSKALAGAAIPRRARAFCVGGPGKSEGGRRVLRLAELLLVIGLIAAAFGFGGIAATPPGFARMVFLIYVVAVVTALTVGLFRRPPAA
jgi:uncharacterized membrane protein YtjA (UPF0391 family)